MRILFLIDNLRPGGAQKALLALARAALAAGFEPQVWCLGGTSEVEEAFADAGIPVLGRPGSFVAMLIEPIALLRHLRRNDVTILQTFLFHADVTGRILGRLARLGRRNAGRPIIVSSVRASNVRNRWWQFALLRMTAPLADAFTAVSNRTLEFASRHEGVVATRATVIPNGIDPAEWESLPEPALARTELGLPSDAFVVACVGRLHPQKGHKTLLEAAAMALKEAPDLRLLIAGYGPLRAKLESLARELNICSKVEFLGYRTDVGRILSAADLFVLPSLWEGMSNAILEAMTAGRPVVATAVDGNVEQVEHGTTGLLVPPGDPGALAKAILEIRRDPQRAREMGMKGREKVRREFSLERMTRAYLDLYRRLADFMPASGET